MSASVVILTFNSELTIRNTIEGALRVSDDVHVVDSFSTDSTRAIAEELGAHFVEHEFSDYGAQRNWAIASLPLKYEWELHLDADEKMSDDLIDQVKQVVSRDANPVEGYLIPRYMIFMGRVLRHGAMAPTWHLRLFRRGKGRCENRRYDQHFYIAGQTEKLTGAMFDDVRMDLTEWTARHNRWASAEADELQEQKRDGRIAPKLLGSAIERKRFLKSLYLAAPLFSRAFLLFFYHYILRLGFLDGREGFIYAVLQTFWFRFLVDAKLYELKKSPKP